MGKGRCGLSDVPAGRTEEQEWGHGISITETVANGEEEWQLQGELSAETTPGAGSWHKRGSKGKACDPQPACAFYHCSKLALEYGWGYFMITYKSSSDDMNLLMRWSCDRIPRKAINFSADVFLKGGRSCLVERFLVADWILNLFFVAVQKELKSKALLFSQLHLSYCTR